METRTSAGRAFPPEFKRAILRMWPKLRDREWAHAFTADREYVSVDGLRYYRCAACAARDGLDDLDDPIVRSVTIPVVKMEREIFGWGERDATWTYWFGICPGCDRLYWADTAANPPDPT